MTSCTFRMTVSISGLGMESRGIWSMHRYIPDTMGTGVLGDRYRHHLCLFDNALLGALPCDLKLMIYAYSYISVFIHLLHSLCPHSPSLSPSRLLTNQDICHCHSLCIILPWVMVFFYIKWIVGYTTWISAYWRDFASLLTSRPLLCVAESSVHF